MCSSLVIRTVAVPGFGVWLGLVSSCTSELPREYAHDHLPARPAETTVLADRDVFAFPSALAVTANFIVVTDPGADSVFHVLDRTTGAYLRPVGRRGEGPGEFVAPWSVRALGGDTVMVYDIGIRRVTYLTRAHLDGTADSLPRHQPLHTEVLLNDVAVHDDGFMASGFFPDARLVTLDQQGSVSARTLEFPAGADAPGSVLGHAYQSRLVQAPSGANRALMERHSGYVTFSAGLEQDWVREPGPFPFEPVLGSRWLGTEQVFRASETLRFGYVDGAADDEYLYALFSSRLNGVFGPTAPLGRYIHVFRWATRTLESVLVTPPLVAIAMPRTGGALYGITWEPVPSVVKIKLGSSVVSQDAGRDGVQNLYTAR